MADVPDSDVPSAPPVKPGWKTSEFWLTAAAAGCGALLATGVFPDTSPWAKILGVGSMVLAALGYNWSRTTLKR